MNKTIQCVSKKSCCGCSACVQKCPKNAIKMVEDEEGFFYPVIDKRKCINCGLCQKVCPAINFKSNIDAGFPVAYAVKNKDNNDLIHSSSGGMFSVLAKMVLQNNGVVYGAAYDKNNKVIHIGIDSEKELKKLQGSKYVQSDINNSYINVERNLKSGKLVLFTGTPCQIKGLKNFLIRDYDNLITCDLVCHGVPSQKLFAKYIDYLEKKYKRKIKSYNFRSKERNGWGLTAKVVFKNKTFKFINSDFDPYYSNFLNCNTYRLSCYNCEFACLNRTSDITLADYWGVLQFHSDFYSKDGVSLVLINSKKGKDIFNKVKDKIEYIDTDISNAIQKNKNLIKSSTRTGVRSIIYNGINSNPNFIKSRLKVKITLKKVAKLFISNDVKKIIIAMKGKKT